MRTTTHKRGRASRGRKGKGRGKAASPESRDDVLSDADFAPLESIEALFSCGGRVMVSVGDEIPAVTGCFWTTFLYVGLLEHWQTEHPALVWYSKCGHFWTGSNGCRPPRLRENVLVALGLTMDATQREVHRLVTSGRPVRTCGKKVVPESTRVLRSQMLHNVVRVD
ncbi:hypothetical protein C8Q80DRAFT_688102 [Daedaleopsis nitida]|nr:hypothetical protein C8Q80DRAFT_688102 [Daedaleopsis nitida]